MSTDVWLPIATLVLGIVLGYVGDWLRESRTVKRDREYRWRTFQRETILEAQRQLRQHMWIIIWFAEELLHSRDRAVADDNTSVAADVTRRPPIQHFNKALEDISLLRSRIHDPELKSIIAEYLDLNERLDTQGVYAQDYEPILQGILELSAVIDRFDERVLELGESLY
jgi:hypothetical protein